MTYHKYQLEMSKNHTQISKHLIRTQNYYTRTVCQQLLLVCSGAYLTFD